MVLLLQQPQHTHQSTLSSYETYVAGWRNLNIQKPQIHCSCTSVTENFEEYVSSNDSITLSSRIPMGTACCQTILHRLLVILFIDMSTFDLDVTYIPCLSSVVFCFCGKELGYKSRHFWDYQVSMLGMMHFDLCERDLLNYWWA